jgi:hypothetical protein
MDLLKVMVTNDQDDVIWDAMAETNIQTAHRSYFELNKEIDLQIWKQDYRKLYLEWLHHDNESIYDVHHPINLNVINSLIKVNKIVTEYKLYYWFDVDRDKYPNFRWEVCPLSGNALTNLPNYFHINNRKISQLFPLIFPEIQ